jgi:aspartyl-tRNA(Asn)/glutamyl-tRNA(Gln) amidotransferase subunit C
VSRSTTPSTAKPPAPTVVGREQVRQLARLARLELDEDELEPLGVDLGRILGYVQLLGEVDRADVEPFVQAPTARFDGRPDEVEPSLSLARALQGAPCASERGFEVPGTSRTT